MIRTWVANIEPLMEDACYKKYYFQAPSFRQKKADVLNHPKKKAQSIGVWSVYAQMKDYYGFDQKATFNFSHSENYVLCSVCVKEEIDPSIRVGCDLEWIDPRRKDPSKMAKHFFCPVEYETILQEKEEASRRELFYRYWVLKESFLKATGKGMALPLDSFEVALGEPSYLVRQPEEFSERYIYMESTLDQGKYRVAVCSTDEELESEIHEIQLR